jgi:hypothetical protein
MVCLCFHFHFFVYRCFWFWRFVNVWPFVISDGILEKKQIHFCTVHVHIGYYVNYYCQEYKQVLTNCYFNIICT